jgi:small-conductance mechanosensitive channel
MLRKGLRQIFVLLLVCGFAAPAWAAPAVAVPAVAVHVAAVPAATPPAAASVGAAEVEADVLQATADQLDRSSGRLEHSLAALDQLPLVAQWARHLADSSLARRRAEEVFGKLMVLLFLAGACGWIVRRGTRRLLHRLALMTPADVEDGAEEGAELTRIPRAGAWHLARMMPFVLARLLLDLLPVALFLAVGYLLLGTALGQPRIAQLVGLVTIYALVAARGVWCVMRMLVAPDEPRLRLVAISTASARSVVRWTSLITLVGVAGVALVAFLSLLGLSPLGVNALRKLMALILHLMLIAAVLRARVGVAQLLRAKPGDRGVMAAMRDWAAGIWAWVAIAWIVALWFVWAIEREEGAEQLLEIGALSLLVLIGARLIAILGLGSLERLAHISPDRAVRLPGIERRIIAYTGLASLVFRLVLGIASALLLFQLWGWQVGRWVDYDGWGRSVLSGGMTILVAVALGAVVWEAANWALHRRMEHLIAAGAMGQLIRLRTIGPILRTALLLCLVLILALTVLSQFGVNVGPLLAGAGIVGLAIGFGAQKLVQDVITGLFLLLDNAVQVGDGITAAGLSGTVEHLSLRCLQLRADDGSLHFIPFSAVSTVTNNNRGRALALLRFEFGAHADLAMVNDILRKVGQQLQDEEALAPLLLDDVKLPGIESMNGDKIVVSVQIACLPAARGTVSYEFRRRLLLELKNAGIELAGSPPPVQFIAAPVMNKESPAHVA